MPTYVYIDTDNGEMFEYKQSMNDKPLEFWPEDVPGYDAEKPRPVRRKVGGGTGFILKGSGWYKTDYTSPGNAKNDTDRTTDSAKPKTEDKIAPAPTSSTESKSE
ncbi:MAG: hypothetical protein Kapaf2KO_18200 [Candidatus Kapaibacteriales bacterium]